MITAQIYIRLWEVKLIKSTKLCGLNGNNLLKELKEENYWSLKTQKLIKFIENILKRVLCDAFERVIGDGYRNKRCL